MLFSTIFTCLIQGALSLRSQGIQCCAGNYNHRKCANEFQNNKSGVSFEDDDVMKASQSSHSAIKLSFPGKTFNFQSNCMLCGTFISSPISTADGISMVQTLRLQKSIHGIANSRNDCWGRPVEGQIQSIIDLPAADARFMYHHSCNSNFRTGKDIPYRHSNNTKRRKSGRPVDEKKQDAFHQVFIFFHNNA